MVVNKTEQESLRARYGLDIEQLDYKYVRNCENARIMEKILDVLRSGQEGVYPDLIRFTEDRLRSLKPNSAMLRTEQPATTLRALDSEARDRILSDLEQWKSEVTTVDAELKLTKTDGVKTDEQLPPIRGSVQLSTSKTPEPEPAREKPPRIPSYDYAAWDKYDVEAELRLLEESREPQQPGSSLEPSDPAIDDQPAVQGLSQAERAALALREKEKGNEYFRSGDFVRAAVYYTRSIHANPSVAAYNNRAQANLKLNKYGSALMDCGYVLRREPDNVKAILRRGIARQMNKDWIKARLDFQRVLELEPQNVQAKRRLEEVERNIVGSDSSRKKMLIEEVDSMEVLEKRVEENDQGCNAKDGKQFPKDSLTSTAGVERSRDDNSQIKKGDREGTERKQNDIAHLTSPAEDCDDKKVFIHEVKEVNAIGDTDEDLSSDVVTSTSPQDENHSNPEPSQSKLQTPFTYSDDRIHSSETKGPQPSRPELSRLADLSATERDRTRGEPQRRSPSELNNAPEPSQNPASEQSTGSSVADTKRTGDQTDAVAGGRVTRPTRPQPRLWKTYEFMQRWRALKATQCLSPYVELLRSVMPHQLTVVFGSELDASVLSTVIRCVSDVMLKEDGPQRCQQLLEHLSRAERFHVVKLLLDKRDHDRLNKIAAQFQRLRVDVSLLTRRFLL